MKVFFQGNIARIFLLFFLLLIVQGKAGGFVLAQDQANSAKAYQESGDQKLESEDLAEAMKDFRESRRLFFEAKEVGEAVTSGMGLAICEVYEGDFSAGRDILLQGRDSLIELDPGNDSLLANIYGLLGSVYSYLGDQEKALETALEAVAVKKRISDLEPGDLEYNYAQIGAIYFERNDFAQAIEYERAARKGYKAAGMTQEYAETGINLGLALVRSAEYVEALEILTESEKLLDLNALEPREVGALFVNIGLANMELKQVEAAREAFLRVRPLPEKGHKYHGIAEGNMGLLYLQQGQATKAIELLQFGISILRFQGNADPDELGKLHLHLAQAYRLDQNYPAALQSVDAGIIRQLYLSITIEVDTLSDYSKLCDRRTLLRLLSERAALLDIMDRPEDALKAYQHAFTVIDLMRHTFYGEDSRQFLAAYVQPIYEQSLDLAWKLYSKNAQPEYFEEALQIAERNKSVLLLEAMQEARARRGEGHPYKIPDSLIRAERSLQNDIAWYQKQLYWSGSPRDREKASLYEGYLIEKQAALDLLQTKLQNDFPFLGRRESGINSSDESGITLAAIQGFCARENRAVLEYFAGEKHTYALMASQEKLVFERFDCALDDSSAVASYRKALSDWSFIYEQPRQAWKDLKAGGRHFYQQLVQPIFKDNVPAAIVVIPDGRLSYLPFEALLTDDSGEEGDYSGLPYLLRKSDISYAYSVKLLLSRPSSSQAIRYTGKALAFAPLYPQAASDSIRPGDNYAYRKEPASLPGAKEEVLALSRHLKVESYAGKAATEANFKVRAGSHAVLHLAMHGILDDANADYSFLDFADERIRLGSKREDGSLFAYELEQMRLPAQLVVLSACETGTGKLMKGEGVMSLARGFMFAGAQSVVMSLWKLEDRSTAELMDLFYGELAKEAGKSTALRDAKLAYLDQADDFTSHPGFWAGLVLIGNTDALQKPVAPPPWALPLAALLVIFTGFGLHRYSGSKGK